jgi:hypothetical protein
MENKEKALDLTELGQVSGGGILSGYSVEEYNEAGIMVIGVGWLYNDGYRYEGKEISTYEARCLMFYYNWYGKRAPSIDEAVRFREYIYDIIYDEF